MTPAPTGAATLTSDARTSVTSDSATLESAALTPADSAALAPADSAAGTPAGASPRSRAWMMLVPAMFLLAWGGNHFTPLLHMYEHVGNYETWQANFLLCTYVLGLVPGLLVASAMSDQHGRKPVMFIGMLMAIVGSILLALGFATFWLLCVGRAFAGFGVGIAMSVGTSWMKELSSAPFDLRASVSAGARRPAMTLTAGFGIGAGVTGALAQWAPHPGLYPYLVHLALSVASLFFLWRTPESLAPERRSTTSWWRDLAVPSASHRTFVRLILPAAPWVFGAAAVAYAIMPAVVEPVMGDYTTIFAAALTIVTLGTGAAIQSVVPRINDLTGGKSLIVGMVSLVIGVTLAVWASVIASPLFVMFVCMFLGAAYGITIVSALLHVQQIATPSDLAGLTGVYYSLTYVGFLLPTILALLLPVFSYTQSLMGVAVLCVFSLVAVVREYRHSARTA